MQCNSAKCINLISEWARDWQLHIISQLECGPMPNVMVALPNIGGALCSTPQSFADVQYSSAVQ